MTYTYNARIVRVIDGDTVVASIDVGFDITVVKHMRLLGVDTPERGQEGFGAARDYMLSYEGREALIQTYKSDSFGRYLCKIFVDGICINSCLLALDLAKPWKLN